MSEHHHDPPDETVLVVDFGAQYAQLIARRVREARVYSEIVPHTITAAEIAERKPTGIVFSGGPQSVHVDGAPRIDPDVYDLEIPILGICYGAQLIAYQNDGVVGRNERGEYGRTEMKLASEPGTMLAGTPDHQDVWMSHFDAITELPDGFDVTASTLDAPVAAFENSNRGLYGVQFHPEVGHTPHGQHVFEQFLNKACGAHRGMDDGEHHRDPGRPHS